MRIPSGTGRSVNFNPLSRFTFRAAASWLLWFSCGILPASGTNDIGILARPGHLQADITRLAIEDVRTLLQDACSCPVTLDDAGADILIALHEVPDSFRTEAHYRGPDRPYPYFHYPDHGYTWNISRENGQLIYALEAASQAGISNGLYGLLQEVLGFAFYHPRETHVPDLRQWPEPAFAQWRAEPRFEKKGFHLHTQHPLELTEALMMLDDASWPRVKEYIDWLARNQQNYFEYNLLEGIHRATWPGLAARMVDYLHSRGIIAGLDLSLHMMQQKSFMLYENPPNSLRSKEKQIRRNTDLLFAADWDLWNVEFSTTEFTGGNVERKKKLQAYLNRLLLERGAKLMGRAHVVKEEALLGGEGPEDYYRAQPDSLDAHRGIMSHTVMFYTASEPKAPVYGNENLQHMLELLLEEQRVRETWYYPESAYWITFDNSVPMLLLPYLKARHDDIMHMHQLGVQGHLTFSSGWEWGYWLVDWSIARWSWAFEADGVPVPTSPAQFARDIPVSESFMEFLPEATALQQAWLKDSNLIAWLTAQTVTDEMPGSLNLHLHPRPDWRYGWLMNEAPAGVIDTLRAEVLPALEAFDTAWQTLRDRHYPDKSGTTPLERELLDATDIVALRARHRRQTLEALIRRREENMAGVKSRHYLAALDSAAAVRLNALELVRAREAAYRYPAEELATQRWDHTAYHFGYLYTVHDLHFWSREEAQIRENRWGPLFRNIWTISRIIGLTD